MEQSSERDHASYTAEEKDFQAVFNRLQWTIEWQWKEGCLTLKNRLKGHVRSEFEGEVEGWIKEGVLNP